MQKNNMQTFKRLNVRINGDMLYHALYFLFHLLPLLSLQSVLEAEVRFPQSFLQSLSHKKLLCIENLNAAAVFEAEK